MTTFTARVERDGNWWIAQLDEEPGVMTQARSLEQIPDALKDALALFPELTTSPDDATIKLHRMK